MARPTDRANRSTESRASFAPGAVFVDDGHRHPEPDPHHAERAGRWILTHPARSIIALAVAAGTIEAAQRWPELFAGAHALGEVIRNLAYALLTALIFHWIVVQLPEERRRRTIYEHRKVELEWLVKAGPAEVALYRTLASADALDLDVEVDAWDRDSIFAAAKAIAEQRPGIFNDERSQSLASLVMTTQECLNALAGVVHLVDPDVSKALGLFPSTVGVRQLRPPAPNATVQERWKRDAQIVWELVDGSHRLLHALQEHAPGLDLQLLKAEGGFGLDDKSFSANPVWGDFIRRTPGND